MRKMTEEQLRRIALMIDRLDGDEGVLAIDSEEAEALRALRASAEDAGVVEPPHDPAVERGWERDVIERVRAERQAAEREIVFSGASDDLVLIEGAPGAGEPGFTADARGEWNVLRLQTRTQGEAQWSGAWRVIRDDGSQGLRVHAIYDGCWTFAVGKLTEDAELPGWQWELREGDAAYALELRISAPADVVVEPLFEAEPED